MKRALRVVLGAALIILLIQDVGPVFGRGGGGFRGGGVSGGGGGGYRPSYGGGYSRGPTMSRPPVSRPSYTPSRTPVSRPSSGSGLSMSRPSHGGAGRPPMSGTRPSFGGRPETGLLPGGSPGLKPSFGPGSAGLPGRTGIGSRPGQGGNPGLRPGQGLRPGAGEHAGYKPGQRPIQPGRWPGDWHGWHHGDWNHGHWWWHHYYPWGWPAWAAIGAWIGGDGWDDSIPYDYGVDNGYVYNGGSQVAPVADYAQQANQIAQAAAPTSDEEEWMPLGMFGIAPPGQDEIKVTLQLAVAKDGTIGGTFMNSDGNVMLDVTGAVDKKTQRAAWKVGEGKDAVTMITGLSNLTQDKGTILLFFANGTSESWNMTRMDQDTAKKMQAAVSGDTETRRQLIAAWQELEPNLDERWKDYLDMPQSVLTPTQATDAQELRAALSRFKLVKANPELKDMSDQPEFQKTYDLLDTYLGEM